MSNLDEIRGQIEDQEKNDSGFGTSFTSADVRLMNPNGTLNVKIHGMERWKRFNLYKELIKLKTWQFYFALLMIYVVLNLGFAIGYYLIGMKGLTTPYTEVRFLDVFFFSMQTFTTVGYGHISPNSLSANILSSLEAFFGLLYFAVATGLVYGRFSNSKADVRFSDKLLITKSNDEDVLMIRLANVSTVELSDLNAEIIMSWIEKVNGAPIRSYRKLDLELESINLLTTSWTIVHKISETSPCQIMNESSDYTGLEFMVFVSAFDEVYDQQVKVRTSYVDKDLIKNMKFVPITSYHSKSAVVNLDLLSKYEELT